MMLKSMNNIFLGFDLQYYLNEGFRIPVLGSMGHMICVGGSGSGKSTALLYWIFKMKKSGMKCDLHIMDFKASKEFDGITSNYAEYEDCYKKIKDFYEMFMGMPEGGDGHIKILLIDEIAGLLTFYSMSKEGKTKADEIRYMMSSILMLGRSRKCFLWLAMQRYSATIFPASSGAVDNFHICVGLGRLSVDSRRSLFAGEHFEGEEDIQFGQGKGIVLLDGQPLKAIIIPRVSKAKMLKLLQEM